MSAGPYGAVAYAGSGDPSPEQFIGATGIAGGEAFGTDDSSVLNDTGPQPIFATGIASDLAFGLLIRNPMHATGIASAEAFGNADLTYGIDLDVDDRSIIISDTFTEASDIDLVDHTPDIDTVGTGWVDWSTNAAVTIEATGDKATGDDSGAVIDAGVTDYEVSADVYMDRDTGNRQYPGLVVKGNINIDGYMLWMGPSAGSPISVDLIFHAYRDHSYVFATTLVTGSISISDLDTVELKARVEGRTVTGWVDGVETFKVDVDSYGFVGKYLDRENSTHVGVSGWGDALSTWDNFLVKSIDDSYGLPSAEAFGAPAVSHDPQSILFEPLLIIDDEFEEAYKSVITLDNHTPYPTNTPGGSWTAWNGAVGTIVGGAGALGYIFDDEWVLDAGVGNARVQADMWPHRDSVSEWPGVVIRGVDNLNHIYARFETSGVNMQVVLYKNVAGTHTLLATGTWLVARASSYLWRRELAIEANDDVIDVYIDGALDITHTLVSGDETTFAKAGAQYVGVNSNGAGGLTHVERFRVWDIEAGYGIASAEAVGENGAVTRGPTISTNGIESGEAFGNAKVVHNILLTPIPTFFVGMSSQSQAGTTNAVLVPKIAGLADGDWCVAYHAVDDNNSLIVAPSGWTAYTDLNSSGGRDMTSGLLYHEVTDAGSEPDNWTFSATGDTLEETSVAVIAFRGIGGIDALSNSGQPTYVASTLAPQVSQLTTLTEDAIVIGISVHNQIAVTDVTTDVGEMLVWTASNYTNIGVSYIAQAAIGTSTQPTHTYVDGSGTQQNHVVAIALVSEPIPGGGIASGEAVGTPSDVEREEGAAQNISLDSNGIASAEAFGSPYLSIMATGIPSEEAFGAPYLSIMATGIASAEAIGSPALTHIIDLDSNGIASEEAFGSPYLSIMAIGIASAEAIGSPDLTYIIKTTGIASEEAFGDATLSDVIKPVGIASEEAFGNAKLTHIIKTTGIPSAEAFGSPYLSIMATGIASAEAVGQPALSHIVKPIGIVSGEAFGSPYLSIMAIGIPSEEAFGDLDIIFEQFVDLDSNGIASGEAFGNAKLTYIIKPTGIPSGEAFGDSELEQDIDVTGIVSGEAIGLSDISYIIKSIGIVSGEAISEPAIGVGAVDIDLDSNGIASAEAFGNAKLTQIVKPTGIVSGEAFGSPYLSIMAIGIASGEAVGTPAVGNAVFPTGIVSAEAFGNADLSYIVKPTGIVSGEVFGDAEISSAQPIDVDGNGIASAEAFGNPKLTYVVKLVGIPSAAAFGNPDLTYVIKTTGIDDGNLFGEPVIFFDQVIEMEAILSAEAFGNPALSHIIKATGIPSAEAIGSHAITTGAVDINVASNGIASGEAFGNADLSYIIDASGIPSAEAFGSPNLSWVIAPTGIPSGETFGSIEQLKQYIDGSGIVSDEAFGNPGVVHNIVAAGGIASAEAFGSPTLIQIIQVTGIASGEAFGLLTIPSDIIGAGGIASGEAVGVPLRIVFTDDGCVVQVVSIVEARQTISLVGPVQVITAIAEDQTIEAIEPDQVIDECEAGVVVGDYLTN